MIIGSNNKSHCITWALLNFFTCLGRGIHLPVNTNSTHQEIKEVMINVKVFGQQWEQRSDYGKTWFLKKKDKRKIEGGLFHLRNSTGKGLIFAFEKFLLPFKNHNLVCYITHLSYSVGNIPFNVVICQQGNTSHTPCQTEISIKEGQKNKCIDYYIMELFLLDFKSDHLRFSPSKTFYRKKYLKCCIMHYSIYLCS